MRFNKEEIRQECFSFDVSGYSAFVDRKKEIIADLVAGAPSLAEVMPMTGAKPGTTVELNRLSTSVNWQLGNCVTSANTTTTLAPRTVSPVRITDREELCLDDLDAVLPMLQSAGANNTELPFAEVYMGLKVAYNSNQLEKLAWRGDLTGGTANLAVTDGWLAKANAETGSLGYYATFSGLSAGQAAVTIAQIRTILNNRTDEMRERDDLEIHVSSGDLDIIREAIIDTYGINPTGAFTDSGVEYQAGHNAIFWPGTKVKIIGTHGLNSNGSLFCTFKGNRRYVTDMEHDAEDVNLEFNSYHEALVSKIKFVIGFQYEMPEHVIYIRKV